MYSGTTFHAKSGRVIGVHQKIDRVAYRHVKKYVPKGMNFPTLREILHFEGINGPDGIKRKSPSRDEPWHFIDPNDPNDTMLITMINDHIYNMAEALRNNNHQRAAFEAAWLAHAIVDGLTPAHHYPLEEKLEELRGEGIETRSSAKDKILLPGVNRRAQLRNNWEFWGAKGVMTTHVAFELGVATAVAPLKFDNAAPNESDIREVQKNGFEKTYREILATIAEMGMYDEFSRMGWTRHLARETRNVLMPDIIKVVTMAWYVAISQAASK
jgi:hypothetical protein